MIKSVTLDSSQYYNDSLLELVQGILISYAGMTNVYFQFFDAEVTPKPYSYMMTTYRTDNSYSLSQLEEWVAAGDLADAIETFHNVHKSVYGFRPRYGTDEDWADINWIRQQTKECIESEKNYRDEQEHINE